MYVQLGLRGPEPAPGLRAQHAGLEGDLCARLPASTLLVCMALYRYFAICYRERGPVCDPAGGEERRPHHGHRLTGRLSSVLPVVPWCSWPWRHRHQQLLGLLAVFLIPVADFLLRMP